ncbi:MAG: hypothetical protein A2W07_03085 [candidate division Zixibacteria bacterium RBG_16_43_9]|nr:MAG: hypothetical protein A2W07_03085 [candidate division Zixibacteria bacterium RBG_16_43_9]
MSHLTSSFLFPARKKVFLSFPITYLFGKSSYFLYFLRIKEKNKERFLQFIKTVFLLKFKTNPNFHETIFIYPLNLSFIVN